jgi:hypothetical protein
VTGVPTTQPVVVLAPAVFGEQCSRPLQIFPSSQMLSFGKLWQPCPKTQTSSVHERLSLGQTSLVPNWQPDTALHVSAPLQGSLSSQSEFVAACLQALAFSSHESTVQSTLSSQLTGVPPWQMLFTHVSTPVQNRPSSHCADVVHAFPGMQPLFASHTWPEGQSVLFGKPFRGHVSSASSHFSSVHAIPSAFKHLMGVPAMQPEDGSHVSVPLQKSPSEHTALFAL